MQPAIMSRAETRRLHEPGRAAWASNIQPGEKAWLGVWEDTPTSAQKPGSSTSHPEGQSSPYPQNDPRQNLGETNMSGTSTGIRALEDTGGGHQRHGRCQECGIPEAKNGPRRRRGRRPGVGQDDSWEVAIGFVQEEGHHWRQCQRTGGGKSQGSAPGEVNVV